MVTTVNRIWRSAGSGLINRGCLLLCFCCCFVIMRRDNREALDDVRHYLTTINNEVYRPRGMEWMVLSESDEDGEEEDVVLALEIQGLVDRQPIKRRMSLESHAELPLRRSRTDQTTTIL